MITDPNLSKIYKLLHQLAARLLLEQNRQGREKQLQQLRSFAYRRIQDKMAKHFPNEQILMPLDPLPSDAHKYFWRFYPVAEAENYVRGSLKWTLAISGHLRGRLHKALILEGSCNNYYWACRNGGSYSKFNRLRVSSIQDLNQAFLGCDIRHGIPIAPQSLRRQTNRILNSGSQLLDAVECAAGNIDIFYADVTSALLYPAILLLEEAGGLICDERGKPLNEESQTVLAANERLFMQVLKEKLTAQNYLIENELPRK